MALADHDQLDRKLHTAWFTEAACGSLNLKTGQAEYCGWDCPTLLDRLHSGQNPAIASNTFTPNWDPNATGPVP